VLFRSARALFDPQVIAFGTMAPHMSGIDQLVNEQWRPVWEHTRNFEFELGRCVLVPAGEDHCVVAIPWTSIASGRGDRQEYRRSGRASIVLKTCDGTLRCVHTHFSIDPLPEAFAR
jgi:ketosteroid isomerase-like protein